MTTAAPTLSPRQPFQVLLLLAIIGAIGSGALGLAIIPLHLPIRLSVAFGIFFSCFSVLKFVLALEAFGARTSSGETRREQAFGSPTLFRLWLAYKIIAALVAGAVAVFLFTAGAAAVDRFAG